MPDFRMKPDFPVASVIEAASRNARLQAEARQAGNESLIAGMQSIGQVGQSLYETKKRMAQSLAAAKLLGQTEEGQRLLGTNQVSSTRQGPVTKNQTAAFDPETGSVTPNQPAFTEQTLATAIEGVSPKDLLAHLLPQYVNQSLVQTDANGNIIHQTTRRAPKGSSVTVTKPTAPGMGSRPKPVGINPDTGEAISYDPTVGGNVDTSGNPYTGRIIPMAEGSEEQRRGTLTQTALNSIGQIKQVLATNPKVLSEIKAIRLTPGRVYSQLASPDAKKLYINLKEAISNELYLKTGATANEQEIEDKTLSYMAALNDNPQDFVTRMDILSEQIRPFDQRRRSEPQLNPTFAHLSTKELMELREKATAHKKPRGNGN